MSFNLTSPLFVEHDALNDDLVDFPVAALGLLVLERSSSLSSRSLEGIHTLIYPTSLVCP